MVTIELNMTEVSLMEIKLIMVSLMAVQLETIRLGKKFKNYLSPKICLSPKGQYDQTFLPPELDQR